MSDMAQFLVQIAPGVWLLIRQHNGGTKYLNTIGIPYKLTSCTTDCNSDLKAVAFLNSQ